jgi:hypothetical protein
MRGRSPAGAQALVAPLVDLDRGAKPLDIRFSSWTAVAAEAADARADVAARHSVLPYCATTHFFSRGSREMGRRLEWNCLDLTAVIAVIRVQGPRRHEGHAAAGT